MMFSTQSSPSNIVIGCTAAVVSSACQSVGLILQRKAHLNAQKSGDNSTSPYKRSLWHVGFLLFIVANAFGSTIQITNLPLIVLSPLQSTGLVFNTIFNALILNEPFTRDCLFGTLLVFVGALFIAYFGGQVAEPDTDLKTFIELLEQHPFESWATFCLCVVVILLLQIHLITRELRSRVSTARKLRMLKTTRQKLRYRLANDVTSSPLERLNTRISYNVYATYCTVFNLLFNHTPEALRRHQGILFGCVSGTLSAHSLLLAKSSLDILLSTFSNHELSSLNNPVTYLIVGTFLVLCLSQLFFLNQGLKYVSTSVLYPLVFCVYNLVSIGNGLIFYQQWKTISRMTELYVFAGTLMVIWGVFLLSINGGEQCPCADARSLADTSPLLINNSASMGGSSIYGSAISVKSGPDSFGLPAPAAETSFTSIQDITDGSLDMQRDASKNNNNNLSTSAPLSSTPRSLTNANELLAQISKSTTDASRKVSGFFKKLQHTKPSDLSNTSFGAGGLSLQTGRKRRAGTGRLGSPRLDEEQGVGANEVPEYVSFGSMKDSSSFINNYETQSNTSMGVGVGSAASASMQGSNSAAGGNGASIAGPGLGLGVGVGVGQPPLGVDTSYASFGAGDISHDSITTTQDYRVMRSSDPQLRNAKSCQALYNTRSPRTVGPRKQPSFRQSPVRGEDDYNPNNNFNYSLSNTIEEIQNQMNGSSYGPMQTQISMQTPATGLATAPTTPLTARSGHSSLSAGSAVGSASGAGTGNGNGVGAGAGAGAGLSVLTSVDTIPEVDGESNESSLSHVSVGISSPVALVDSSSRQQSFKVEKQQGRRNRNFTTGMIGTPHQRQLSFEQSELLNEL